jgi:hypothetical protein
MRCLETQRGVCKLAAGLADVSAVAGGELSVDRDGAAACSKAAKSNETYGVVG